MLRAVLLGSLAIAAAACSSHTAAPATAPGAPGGQVITVSGDVTAQRGSAARRLAPGDTVAADDEIDTGSDGAIEIELARNHVHWQLGPGQHQRPSDAAAWNLPAAQQPAKPIDQDTTSAGRPAERQAADTAATARGPAAAAPPAPAVQPVAPGAGGERAALGNVSKDEEQEKGSRHLSLRKVVPPPRTIAAPAAAVAAPAPDVQPSASAAHADVSAVGGAAPPPPPPPPSPTTPTVDTSSALVALLHMHETELQACLSGAKSEQIVLDTDASGVVTQLRVTGGAAMQACVAKVLAKLQLPASAHAAVKIVPKSKP